MDLLDSFDKSYLEKTVYENRTNATEKAFRTLGFNSYDLIKPCSYIGPIWFFGGPPGMQDWFCGWACQFVADCILRATTKYGEYFVTTKIDTMIKVGVP